MIVFEIIFMCYDENQLYDNKNIRCSGNQISKNFKSLALARKILKSIKLSTYPPANSTPSKKSKPKVLINSINSRRKPNSLEKFKIIPTSSSTMPTFWARPGTVPSKSA